MSSKLDRAVKGAPPPDVSATSVAANPKPHPSPGAIRDPAPTPPDPTTLLPSSPPQIYLNLLVLEASLRAQYLHLLSRRRQNTSALTLLGLWLTYFTYAQFFRPRSDDSGLVGGSPYWIVDTIEKLSLTGGCVLAILFWATGQWERGVRWPRRWVAVTNRGLRGFNCKIVLLRQKWWRETLGNLVCALLPIGFIWPTFDSLVIGTPAGGGEYARVEYTAAEKRAMVRQGHQMPRQMEPAEEDVSPGGDVVKLLLLPKPFEAGFREDWEVFRTEFWEVENARRAELRKRVRSRQRLDAKRDGGWLWWTGWRGWPSRSRSRGEAAESAGSRPHSHAHTHSLQHQRELKERKRRSSALGQRMEREASHSRSSSRSSTVTVDDDGGASTRLRRRPASIRDGSAAASRPSPLAPPGSRPDTPALPASASPSSAQRGSGLRKQASSLSTASSDSKSSQESGEPVVGRAEPSMAG